MDRTASHRSEDGKIKLLEEHLQEVASTASLFAKTFNAGHISYLAGLWHDLGKYNPAWQRGLIRVTQPEIQGDKIGIPHAMAGALHAKKRLKAAGRGAETLFDYLIACHHTGLKNYNDLEQAVLKSGTDLQAALAGAPPEALLNHPLPEIEPLSGFSAGFRIRMLFSCLIDADRLDAEAFYEPEKTASRGKYPKLAVYKEQLDAHMAHVTANADPALSVNRERADILRQCREKAPDEPGFFSLTVPTGGGKTLASAAFALDHAEEHNKRRIIYVIPYTSIIEQTAKIFKGIFGAENVIEHHSNFDPEKEDKNADNADNAKHYRAKLAAENWDAPFIVTTNVQFFESLFAAKTGRCRKLHNIANSVVILDEAQMLPPPFLKPVCAAMEALKKEYGVTFLLCTATQPNLSGFAGDVYGKFKGIDNIREIIKEPEALYNKLRRVTVTFPEDFNTPKPLDELADELALRPRVLCIVNTRRECRELYDAVKERNPENLFHLSALMCPAHRSSVIEEIKTLLAREDSPPVRVISTQLIEAGVDVDFPVVYRAAAGLDSIAQSAGRCNREGKLGEGGGEVAVFNGRSRLKGMLAAGANLTKKLPPAIKENPLAPESFKRYFAAFYKHNPDLDKHGIITLLQNEDELKFAEAAAKFRLIEEGVYLPVVTYYDKGETLIRDMLSRRAAGDFRPDRALWRQLQQYTVTVPKSAHERLQRQEEIIEIVEGLFVQAREDLYLPDTGFAEERGGVWEACKTVY